MTDPSTAAPRRPRRLPDPALSVRPGPDGLLRISPTDVSQFIRLDQCARFLRLRLYERTAGLGFMRDQGLVPQQLPPLLSRSGAAFEERVYADIAARHTVIDLAAAAGTKPNVLHNERVLAEMVALQPDRNLVIVQPSLGVPLSGWAIRGAVDLLRIERTLDGTLHLLIVDIKSSARVKVEHFLQVAFYAEMLAALMADAGLAPAPIGLGILYRGPAEGDTRQTPDDLRRLAEHRASLVATFGAEVGLLDLAADPQPYRDAVTDLVTGSEARARALAAAGFDDLPFHLTGKCDDCLYNEFCLRRGAERDDLSLLPHLTERDKIALERAGVQTVSHVASLKVLAQNGSGPTLVTAPGHAAEVRSLSGTWPIGGRLDELIHRASRYRKYKGDPIEALSYIPDSGYSSLPSSTTEQNPNLVLVYLDAQLDHLQDRVYQVGALVVGHEAGQTSPDRRRTIVGTTDGPPDSLEREGELFVRWIADVLAAIVDVAAPDPDGQPRAPIHLVFFDAYAQRTLLDGLARHHGRILAATPLYDFVTQIAAYDSPILTHLDGQIRAQKNYPLLAQTLQAVASWLRFPWDPDVKSVFRHRVFDSLGRMRGTAATDLEQGDAYYVRRARFSSQVPLEYAYAAWDQLPPTHTGGDPYGQYRAATPDLLTTFASQRLNAMEHVARDLQTNPETSLGLFFLPDLAGFEGKAQTLAQALEEFVMIERHADLAAWKGAHLAPPERRALVGDALIARFVGAEQDPEVAAQNRENERRRLLRAEYAVRVGPDGQAQPLTPTEKTETTWTQEGMRFRLGIVADDLDTSLGDLLALTRLRPADRVILHPRWTVDTRRPLDQQRPLTPTARAMLYGMRATIEQLVVDEADADGNPLRATATVSLVTSHGRDPRGFTFGTMQSHARPLVDGDLYTLGPDPNDFYGSWCAKVVAGLAENGHDHTLYRRLEDPASAVAAWPESAVDGQARFFAGLEALHQAGAFHAFEPSKQAYIGRHGDVPTLMVQGPPGTGKSFTSAFALLARIQGAMAAGRDYRAVLSCKTHAATDVLLANVVDARARLDEFRTEQPAIFTEYFDDRLLDVPLFRVDPRDDPEQGVEPLRTKHRRTAGERKAVESMLADRWCVVAATPGGVFNMVGDRWPKSLFGHHVVDALMLDEASQMNLPEAMMASLPLKYDGHLIVVGDHRQMPPIVKHDWGSEPRRTFREFRSFESLFLSLLPQMEALGQPVIRFAESFRLHAEMAEFLRREVYQQDGIQYHSRRTDLLAAHGIDDPLQAAVLDPGYPIVVVMHDEGASIQRNPFEQMLIGSLLTTLADPTRFGFDAADGIGVVVPHRAQRAELRSAVPELTHRDPETGRTILSAVDTVERFQGGERTVIMVGATESDRSYLVASSDFLLDPRRLTVALSRAKQKMILVASRSIFDLFSADDEVFANAQLWKNLLRRTCTVPLWRGAIEGTGVEVWGNAPTVPAAIATEDPR